jgi:hypothetical protein
MPWRQDPAQRHADDPDPPEVEMATEGLRGIPVETAKSIQNEPNVFGEKGPHRSRDLAEPQASG